MSTDLTPDAFRDDLAAELRLRCGPPRPYVELFPLMTRTKGIIMSDALSPGQPDPRRVRLTRGLCPHHYRQAARSVAEGRATWPDLERAGRACRRGGRRGGTGGGDSSGRRAEEGSTHVHAQPTLAPGVPGPRRGRT